MEEDLLLGANSMLVVETNRWEHYVSVWWRYSRCEKFEKLQDFAK